MLRRTLLAALAIAAFFALPAFSSAQSFELVHRFAAGPNSPVGALTEGPDGNFYGVTEAGGNFGGGTVYRVSPAGAVTILHQFQTGQAEGYAPRAGLILASDGFLYGTTAGGGDYDSGTIYRISLTGEFAVVFGGFGDASGQAPYAPATRLLEGADGLLYGTTQVNPSIFRFDPATLTFEELFRFSTLPTSSSWSTPSALMQASDGQFYGVVRSGGTATNTRGVVYRMVDTGAVSIIHQFLSGAAQIAFPSSALVEAPDGHLYGLTAGFVGQNALYRIDLAGSFSTVAVYTDVFTPQSTSYEGPQLLLGSDGYFYVPSIYGYGTERPNGAVVRLDTDGTLSVVHEFADPASGTSVRSSLTLGSDGLLYGVQPVPFSGSVYRVSPLGAFEELAVFKFDTGYAPIGSLVKASDGQLYGTASEGGAHNRGTVFRLDAQGVVTVLHSFGPAEGGQPAVGLRQASDGWLYGTTSVGQGAGCGTVFRISLAGAFETLHEFDCTDGANPWSPLVQVSDGLLYGTTRGGGAFEGGTIYRIATSGAFELLHSFDGAAGGSVPIGALAQATDGLIYGVTEGGGDFGLGTVFRIDLLGQHTIVHSFGDEPDFADAPYGGLLQASDGFLYGTTARGGDQEGLLYRISTDGVFEVVSTSFDQGLSPAGELIQGPDGLLYGTTTTSVATDPETVGTIYRVGVNGVVTVKAFELVTAPYGSAEAFDGAAPTAGLTIGFDGLFYGTTSSGGSGGSGTIFRIDLASETPTGSNIEVQPVDPVTGSAPVNLTFGEVLEPGTTSITTSTTTTAPPPPSTFNLGGTPTYFDVETTAVFAGQILVCFNYGGLTLADPDTARLLHFNGTEWEDVTISNDVATTTICGNVESLSPFVIGNEGGSTYAVNPMFDQEKVYKAGSTIPIRIQIMLDGLNVSASSLSVVATGIRRKSADTNWGTPEDPGQSNQDLNFVFTSVNGEPGYRFNLKTAGSYVGTYELKLSVASGAELVVEFQVR